MGDQTDQTRDGGAYAALRAAILAFELAPGERLSERGLETVAGGSRTPVRAALMRLAADGLVQRAGRGWQVAPIDLAEVRAVMEYREALETAAVRLAVERASMDELEALRLLADAHDDGRADAGGDSSLQEGTDFHVALAGLSRNPFLAEGMSQVLTRLLRVRWLSASTPRTRELARSEHLEIVASVTARDADRAVALVTAHSHGTRDRLLGFLSDERRRLRGSGIAVVESA
ncbi:GntR family transcriptional regulator [Gryllotalpicola protaetiae]|uniref:GntR family transcriptional regulator n=1 Tax=Gryllotalpicola protaetiae TaxID=2419771 RepID=A0A387BR96_9MICO|nr:GntR family transcriptional regulator [Gryllotalpicola protaetiae]AYG03579.1 GntR family transcriptional regulator [Gryllotalpicola protaetiae]